MATHKICKFSIIFGMLALTSSSYADIVNWQLNGVTFSDGGVATGNFSWDTSTSTIVSYHISVSGGNTTNFSPTIYESSNPNDNVDSALFPSFDYVRNLPKPYPNNAIGITDRSQHAPGNYAANRFITLSFASTLSTPVASNLVYTGTTYNGVNIVSEECFNCAPYRQVTGGYISSMSVITATPTQCLFNWKAKSYPTLFTPAASSFSTSVYNGYTYSYYGSTFSYLAVSSSDNHVYSVDTNGVIQDEGLFPNLLLEAGCQAPPPSSSDCLFNWAEKNYPSLFAPIGSKTAASGVYSYRYYSTTNTYLGVSSADNHVYYMEQDGKLQDEGSISKWLPLSSCQ